MVTFGDGTVGGGGGCVEVTGGVPLDALLPPPPPPPELLLGFLFLVWIPSFFIVKGRVTWKKTLLFMIRDVDFIADDVFTLCNL